MPTAKGPLYAVIPGQTGYQSRFIPTGKEILGIENPLVLLANRVKNPYLGTDSSKAGQLQIKSLVVNNPEFEYYEIDPEKTREFTPAANVTVPTVAETPFWVQFTTDITGLYKTGLITNATTGDQFTIEDLDTASKRVQIKSKQQSSSSEDTLPVTLTNTAPSNITTSHKFVLLGAVTSEGSYSLQTPWIKGARQLGYLNIIRHDISQTGTSQAQDPALATKYLSFEEIKKQKEGEWWTDLEYVSFAGRLARTTSNGEVIRVNDGLYNSITTNVIAANTLEGSSSTLSIDSLEDISYRVHKRGGNPVGLVGERLFRKIAKKAREATNTRYNTEMGANEWGFSPDKFLMLFGNLQFVHYPILDRLGYTNQMVFIDPEQILLTSLQNRMMQFKPNTQLPDYDGRQGTFLGEMGILLLNEKMHFKFTGFDLAS